MVRVLYFGGDIYYILGGILFLREAYWSKNGIEQEGESLMFFMGLTGSSYLQTPYLIDDS